MYDSTPAAASASAKALALPERAAALRAWEDAWGALEGQFWKGRAPELCVALPPTSSPFFFLSSAAAEAVPRVRHISARIVDPDPEPGPLVGLGPLPGGDFGDGGLHGVLDEQDHFSFGPWFIAATRDGMNVRASYSYLDLHGCLGGDGVEGGGGGEGGGGEEAPGGKERSDVDGDRGVDYDRACWTVVKVPVWNVVAFALSTELDLAVVISCVFIFSCQFFSSSLIILGHKTIQHGQNRTPGSRGRGEEDEDPFGGAAAALPRWHAAPVRHSADDTVQPDERFSRLYIAGAGAR